MELSLCLAVRAGCLAPAVRINLFICRSRRDFDLSRSEIQFANAFSEMTLFSFSFRTGTAEEVPPAEETDAQPVKRAAEEEEVG